ncbi:MAG TPA: TonB-dependent receptor, partial [Rhodopila sp.]|nr:TonB-dependent receptor [Rhodopila sp.]
MRVVFASAALLIVAASASRADDLNVTIPDQVVTATRIPTPVQDIPAGVTVIDRATIEAKGYNSLQQALTDIPGVQVTPLGGLGGQTSVFIRGTNSNQVLVLRDGMPITDASDPTGAYNFGTDTLSDIERIEIIRGPMAALYGSGAIGGVINLISRRGTQQGIHWEGDLAGGYPALIRGAVSASGIEGPVDFAITAESQSQRGYDQVPQRMTAYNGAPQGFRDRILTLNLGYTPVEGTRLSLFLRADENYFGFVPDDPTFNNTDANGKSSSLLGRIGGSTRLLDGLLDTSAYVGQLQDDRRYVTGLEPANPNLTVNNDRYHSYRTDLQWNNTLHLDSLAGIPGFSRSAMTFGYEYTDDTAKVRLNDSSGGFPYGNSASGSLSDSAAYVGLQTTLLTRLDLTAQLRQDWVVNDSPTTWRVGGVYDLSE